MFAGGRGTVKERLPGPRVTLPPVTCEECGSRQVRRQRVEGYLVDECELCGHLEGEADSVERILSVREARRLGIDPPVYDVVRSLGRFAGLKVVASGAGQPARQVAPFIQFTIAGREAMAHREAIAVAGALCNRGSSRAYWVLEAEYQRTLAFHLKPAFAKGSAVFGVDEIAAAQADLTELARRLGSRGVY